MNFRYGEAPFLLIFTGLFVAEGFQSCNPSIPGPAVYRISFALLGLGEACFGSEGPEVVDAGRLQHGQYRVPRPRMGLLQSPGEMRVRYGEPQTFSHTFAYLCIYIYAYHIYKTYGIDIGTC